jgi:1-deoxy-D-xylulose-5-phosphate reductoisomerase
MDLCALGALEFHPPDFEKFPCLSLAYQALRAGGPMPTVLNAANEVAVAAFLNHEIGFTDIPRVIGDTLASADARPLDSLTDIFDVDDLSRRNAMEIVRNLH